MSIEDDRLDRAIDRAVQDIMHTDPPAGLRRRVIERLEGRPRRGGDLFAWRPALVGLAAMAILIAGLSVLWRDAAPPARETATLAQGQPPAPAAETARPKITSPASLPPAAERGPRPPAARNRMRTTREAIVMPPVANVFGTPSEEVAAATVDRHAGDAAFASELDVAPLAAPAPISVTPLSTAPLVVPRIVIAPIELRRIDVRPATPPR